MPKWPKKDFREVFLGANPNGEEGIMGTISKKYNVNQKCVLVHVHDFELRIMIDKLISSRLFLNGHC